METTRKLPPEGEDTEMRKILVPWSVDQVWGTANVKTMRVMKTGKNGCT
jgi:hypothetical protein